MLDGIFASLYTTSVTAPVFLAVCLLSVALGFGIALAYRNISGESGTMISALTVLPFLVQLVILLVNGNLGAGVAVAGAFSLVRFRSAPGTAKEIATIFLAMAVGLATGMGYLALAALLFVLVGGVLLLLTVLGFGRPKQTERILKVTIPENLDYDGLFDDLFQRYLTGATLEKVKTTNMGTLYELQYRITLRDGKIDKAFLDDLRCRNGNLSVQCGKEAPGDTL